MAALRLVAHLDSEVAALQEDTPKIGAKFSNIFLPSLSGVQNKFPFPAKLDPLLNIDAVESGCKEISTPREDIDNSPLCKITISPVISLIWNKGSTGLSCGKG